MTANSEILKLTLPPEVEVKFYFSGRVPFGEYKLLLDKYAAEKPQNENKDDKWFNRIFAPHEDQSQQVYSSDVSQSLSRVVAITGHRGSGVTSTVVNLAEAALKEQLSVVVIDLDVTFRGINMYFSSFSNEDEENLKSSLIKLLAKPQNYESCTYRAKPGLYVSTLPYSFKDKQLEEKFVTAEKIITMISVLKNKFNLCLIDLPMEIAMQHSNILAHIDTFGLCVKNNLYSVFSTARNMDLWSEKEIRKMLAAKSKIIVTEYNDKVLHTGENFTPNRTMDLLKVVSRDFDVTSTLAGYIPQTDEFNRQIETEVSLVNSSNAMKEAYKKTLIRILEGVG